MRQAAQEFGDNCCVHGASYQENAMSTTR